MASPLRFPEITDQDTDLLGRKDLVARLIAGRFQLLVQSGHTPRQVTEVRHGTLVVRRVGKIEPRQLPFGVGADSEVEIVHTLLYY